jgi:hypothetical protein
MGGLLAAPILAHAEEPHTGTMDTERAPAAKGEKSAKPDEAKKHLSEIDVYLRDAENATRAMYQSSELTSGSLDTTIQKENLSNIERALTNAEKHIQHLKTLPEARVKDPSELDALSRNLADARAQLSPLKEAVRSADRTKIRDASAMMFTQLKRADDSFGQLADTQGLTRIDRIEPMERQPVRGGSMHEEKAPKTSTPSEGHEESPSNMPMGTPEQGGQRY